jgi:tRNA pseudouridine38-40 synthase
VTTVALTEHQSNALAQKPEVFAPDHPDHHLRWAVGVEYRGSRYHGFQLQSATPDTVQQALETAIGSVANHAVRLHCAGRTDAGVHATAQVVHFDTASERPEHGWLLGCNTRLPDDISLQWLKPMPAQFHARFMARRRRYRYVIYNHSVPSALLRGLTTWERMPLAAERMHQAAQCLVGQHDFSAFRAAECQAHSPVRTVTHCQVARMGQLVVLDIGADAFLHHMVRNIMGVLMAIGRGEADVAWAQQVLYSRDRQQAGVTARADGLYLVEVGYDPIFQVPAPAPGPAFLPSQSWQLRRSVG